MATFLQLVQDLARESGTLTPSSITTLAGATGRLADLASWVAKAWRNIQLERHDWFWMKATWSIAALTAGDGSYTSANLGIATRFGRYRGDTPDFQPVTLYDTSIGRDDTTRLTEIGYDEWDAKWSTKVEAEDQGRPIEYVALPDGTFIVAPLPDLSTYNMAGVYFKAPQTLSADGDTPEMPSQFHDLIVWEALRLLQRADGEPTERLMAAEEYVMLRQTLLWHQLPRVVVRAEPLA